MSDFRERNPDDEREVPIDDQDEFDSPDATLDPEERIELRETLALELEQFEGGIQG
ncbi:hypothetical protein [Microbacterium ulmi]|uniref:Uncharacterized protein n=1 Tax=Microbacterium ulmi TaxID=179095 RepID=A0A7Y2M0Y2_9MICO|nr:hypothetical protein [Microbacterium ulmi]NII70587.1 hypothetical protein [Microbacterium ulmi]NNH04172.1 hypothetical protein [Microbacterium ulmi]